jgi:hypothetical protein
VNVKNNKIFSACKSLGLVFDRNSCNVVRPHGRKKDAETWLHFLIKCALFKEFYSRGFTVFSEFKIGNAVVDLFVLDEKWVFEIESKPVLIYTEIENSTQCVKESKLGKHRKDLSVWIVPVSDFVDFKAGLVKWCEKLFGVD